MNLPDTTHDNIVQETEQIVAPRIATQPSSVTRRLTQDTPNSSHHPLAKERNFRFNAAENNSSRHKSVSDAKIELQGNRKVKLDHPGSNNGLDTLGRPAHWSSVQTNTRARPQPSGKTFSIIAFLALYLCTPRPLFRYLVEVIDKCKLQNEISH